MNVVGKKALINIIGPTITRKYGKSDCLLLLANTHKLVVNENEKFIL